VLLEDLAALVGLIFALLGVSLTEVLGDPIWDAAGTLAIGVLLLVVAVIVATETYTMLVGEAATPETVEKITSALSSAPHLTSVIHLRTLHLGPDELLVAAKIGLDVELTVPEVAAAINQAERLVRAVVPDARRIYLEPDLLVIAAEKASQPPSAGHQADA
jgi:divalent metal cation (Fe/Co/Zn/Cd) transporter